MKNYKQIDGKLITDNSSKLDNYYQTSGILTDKYRTEEEFTKHLLTLSKQDLQTFSVYAGVIPTDSQEIIIKLLVAEYKKVKGRKLKETTPI